MSIFSGRLGVFLAAVAGAVVVTAAAYFEFGRTAETPPAPLVAVAPEVNAPQSAVEEETTEPVIATAEPEEVVIDDATPPDRKEAASAADDAADPAVDEASIAAQIQHPSFDEVRREADGMTVIAGQGAPGADVQILLDGTEVSRTQTDGSGKFATLVMIAPDGQGHVLSLRQSVDGEEQASVDQIILAPLDPPVIVAEASTEDPAQPVTAQADAVEETNAAEPVVVASETKQEEAESVQTAQATQVPAPVTDEAVQTPVDEDRAAAPVQTAEPVAEETVAATQDTSAQVVQTDENDEAEPQLADAETSANQEVAVLKTGEDGVELLNTAPPEVMANVELDTISYTDVGEVQLSGRAQPDTKTVRVYLDNASIVNLAVDSAGRWRGDLPDVDEGIYTLRVDEVAADGRVTSRVETPFKRESPAVLASAAAEQAGPLKKITVQKGATLWAIANERYGDGLLYVRVFDANKSDIRDPDLIYPGQVFDLPD
ncbi:LysM peptidoglycan-binding domain-containing protein [Sulfitobacter aestuariivivens]|nr:LysM peptidoglycan-binding domain-containing protein [Sulfitobacter aestuariivivens]